MDELVHHCLRELAFDGDLGCNVSRLRDFIAGFYASQDGHTQSVDDPFCAFVWSVVVQQPSVRVGTLPPGSISEVYIAPQTSAKRKAAEKGEQLSEEAPPALQLVEDARHRHLEDLKREFGDNLRIAVDSETSFAALTGSHIRPSKLSPMVYSALQLITRGREEGITTVELGRRTNYDQKTCFYLIKQLVELCLIVKVRRGGVGNHTCIHKYFVQRSPLWQQIQEEEARCDETIAVGQHVELSNTADEFADQTVPSWPLFDPIESRHLSSLPLVKNRVVKLLRASDDHIHQSNNLLMTIGFANPTKTDRRFFQTRLRELIQQGVIERVLVPSSKTRDRKVKCIRLVTSDSQLPAGSVVVRQDADEDEKDPSLTDDISVGHNEVKPNLTIHKQVSNMLEEAGLTGLTLNEICGSLGNFDKRTVELLLARASNNKPPVHLADLGTVDLMETHGRERRHRYFTLATYKSVMANERLQDTALTSMDVDLSRVGDFATFHPKHFYTTVEMLHCYQDSFKDLTTAQIKKRKRNEANNGEESEVPKRKRGRPRKMPTDSPTASSPKKCGRPRKNPLARGGAAQSVASTLSPSKSFVEVCAEGRQVVANIPHAPGQANQDVPSPSSGGSMSVDNNQPSPFIIADHPRVIKSTTNIPPVVPPRERCNDEDGTWQLSPGNDTSDVYSHIAEPRYGDAKVLDDRRLSERDGIQRKRSASVTRVKEPTAKSVTAGQESSSTTIHDGSAREKHKDAALQTSTRPSKRSRTNGGGKSRPNINISSLRRENELLNVIESMGGVANTHSKDIFEAHTALLDTMFRAGEPTSAPVGTRLDKRTAESTLKNLESRGRIRMLKTSLITSSGVCRPTCLVYLPDTPQERVNAFLRQLSQNVPSGTSTEKQLEEASDFTGLPRHAVLDHPIIPGGEVVPDLEKAGKNAKQKRKAKEARSIEAKPTIRKKAEEAQAERTRDWDDLLRRNLTEPVKGTLAVRIRAVRTRFMRSTTTRDQSHWENEIREAVKETQLISKKIALRPGPRLNIELRDSTAGLPTIVSNPPEKSIETLINQQGPPITHSMSVIKRRKTKGETEASRRPRFHWTREFDELARDASAIVRARCRASRLDLSAFDQVFPAVPRNSVRQRITHLRESAADDLYMKRLEDQWYAVWLKYRGTSYLPDDDPSSPSNFNLICHIDFLRKYVDKNALRVGFVEREAQNQLPGSVKELHHLYEIEEDAVLVPAWDFMWGTAVEEGREKQFRSQAFTKELDNMFEDMKDDELQNAAAALKMVFGTPGELYDPDAATRLLRSVGDQCVSVAKSNLLHQGILSKLIRDQKKPKPGRMLKISDANLSGLGGLFPRDLFQDAISLEDIAVERVVDEMEWPLISSEGDIATLLQLVSEDQVDFAVDLSQSRAAWPKIDWNSKRADDEDIETSIRLRFCRTSAHGQGGNQDQSVGSSVGELNPNIARQEIHGMTIDGREAACMLKTEIGIINCSACINTAFSLFTPCLSQSDRSLACRILDCVRSRKEAGLTRAACLSLAAGEGQHILGLAHRMTLTTPPILLWRYFSASTIVASDYGGAWGVVVSEEPLTLVAARRWLDLRGCRLDSAWKAALQAVVGVIFLHPGVSQAELRWRLRTVYDRQEIIDVLSSLQEDGVVECQTDPSAETITIQNLPGWLKALDDEKTVFWFIATNHRWYQF